MNTKCSGSLDESGLTLMGRDWDPSLLVQNKPGTVYVYMGMGGSLGTSRKVYSVRGEQVPGSRLVRKGGVPYFFTHTYQTRVTEFGH